MHYVYLINIENTDLFKIGFTRNNPQLRLESLQTGNPFKMVLTKFYKSYKAIEIETILHNSFKSKKYTEDSNLIGEWFQLKVEDVINFQETCEKIESNIDFLKNHSTLFD